MTAILLGSLSLGDAIPGLQDTVNSVGGALTDLKGIVDAGIGNITNAQNAINGLASDIDGVKDDLLLGPLGDLQSAVDSAQGLLDDLGAVVDPGAYLSGILSALDDARALLAGLPPLDYLNDAISAVNGGINGLQGKVDSMVGDLADMSDISGLVRDQTAILGDIANALTDASNAVLGGIVDYTEQVSEFLNSGVYVVQYTGALSSLGGEVDAVLAASGLGGSTTVSGPLLLVATANTPSLAALNKAFGL